MGCVDSEPERVVSAPTRTPTNANNQRKSARRKINRLISDYTINDYE
jgi:hypothetical protein